MANRFSWILAGVCFVLISPTPTVLAANFGTVVQDQEADKATADESEKKVFVSTHIEGAPLVPKRNEKTGQLHTFKLTPSGNIVAGVRFENEVLQVYSPDFELLQEVSLQFPATAIAVTANGDFVIGGNGRIGLISATGELMREAPAPHLSGESAEEAKLKYIAAYKEQMAGMRKMYEEQMETMKTQIERLQARKDEKGDDFSKREQSRLDSLTSQLDAYREMIEQQFDAEISDEQLNYMLESRQRIPSIAVSGDDVFVAVSASRGYEIWRTDANFENGAMIIDKLSGCCGQFDFYAQGENLFLAENSQFQVGIYDRDGNRLSAFGRRGEQDETGFGSCCNPMNVICTANGEILTAESSIGKIKRFNRDGELLTYVGKARIGGGCKHVALGFDESRNRYYIQNQDKNQISVLVAGEDAESLMAATKAARAEADAAMKRLDGKWKRVEANEAGEKTGEKNSETDDAGTTTSNQGVDFDFAIVDNGSTNAKIVQIDNAELADDGDDNDFFFVYMAIRTSFGELDFDSQRQNLNCKIAVSDNDKGKLAKLAQMMGDGIPQDNSSVSYKLVPQRFQDGILTADLENSEGLIEFELTVKFTDEGIVVTIKDDFQPNGKSMVFKRPEAASGVHQGVDE